MPHVCKRHRWRRRLMGETEWRAQDAMPHRSRGCSRKEREEGAATQQEKHVSQTEVEVAQSANEAERGAPLRSQTIVNGGGNSRARETAHQRVCMGRSSCTKRSKRRRGQPRQRKRSGSMPRSKQNITARTRGGAT